MFKYLLTFSSLLILLSCTTDGLEDFITINEPEPIIPNTSIVTPSFTIILTANEGGVVSGGGTFQKYVFAIISATPNSGFQFSSWSDGSTNQTRTINVTQDLNLTANFTAVTGNFTLTVNSQAGGTVSSSGGTYEEGAEITLTATPNDGYAFVSWSNGVTNESITILITSNTTLTANFDIIPPDTVSIAENGITIIASPLADVGSSSIFNGNEYIIVSEDQLRSMVNEGQDLTYVITSKVTNMNILFLNKTINGDISSWDVSNVNSMRDMFWGSVFNGDISSWDVSNVTDMAGIFNHSTFNQDISSWDVSNVTNMGWAFNDSDFNKDISQWNVSNVTDMQNMFAYSSFNQPIGNWDVSNVTNMNVMFEESLFDGDISSWDVSNVTSMIGMFKKSQFNKPIGNWDVSNVTDIGMIFESSIFNQPIGNWDVSKVFSMFGMFFNSPFNQSIGNWDVSNVVNMNYMFQSFPNSREYHPFNQDISNWDVSKVIYMEAMFSNSLFNQDISNWNVSQVSFCGNFANRTPNWTLPKPNFTNCTPN